MKHFLTRPVEDFAFITDGDNTEDNGTAPQILPLEPETEKTAHLEDELTNKLSALESGLAEVRRQLSESQKQIEEMQSQFALQLGELQAEKDSLIFDLEQTTKEINDLKSMEAISRARVTALESELDAAKTELEKARRPDRFAKPQLLSEVGVAQTEPPVLLSEREQNRIAVSVEKKTEPSIEVTVTEDNEAAEMAIEESQSQPQEELMGVQIERQIESSIETTSVQLDNKKEAATEVQQFQPIVAKTELSVPSNVTAEQIRMAVFDNETEMIIFKKALSDIDSPDEATRIEAVKAMAGIHSEFSVRAIVARMAKESVSQIRAECIKALAKLNMKEGLPVIERALNEKTALVRLAAVRALFRLAGAESAPTLIPMLFDENEDVRRRTATCIGWLGNEELAAELVPLLDDSSASVRRAAVEAVGNLGSRQVVPELIEHLSDPEKSVRKAIITTLETTTGKKMKGPFPRDKKSLQLFIMRWRQWWRDPASQISLAGTLER